jgi:hypothetical protein
MSDRNIENEDRFYTTDFNEVLKREYDTIRKRRKILKENVSSEGDEKDDASSFEGPPPWLFGVALSGGGIRSASFCLGGLQALYQYKLIPRMDYLSRVSGGNGRGYDASGNRAAEEE